MSIGFKAMQIFFFISLNFLFSFVLNSLGLTPSIVINSGMRMG